MDHLRRYIEDANTAPTTPCGLSIGSPSQRFFDSESDNDDHQHYGTCNGYNSHPGSKSNLLLCMQCDLEARSCSYRPRIVIDKSGKSVEDERAIRCEECFTAKLQSSSDDCQCMHCDYPIREEADLICFRCENEEEQTTEEEGVFCSKCEEPSTETTESPGQNGSGTQLTSSSSENGRYPIDAVVKIQVNDKLLDDSDDTNDESSILVNQEIGNIAANRLSPIVEYMQSDSNNEQEDENQLDESKIR
ncbi:uncharacterized protein [Chelonus insularis]|uniref:uncharacterized protein n=1 Tax=Chelonus insularis TaxID=460826 RepID=UPI00158ED1BF|nr:uncharacterized protein LOC118074037 [Chelonus insularis]